jgi:hypothetical protein
MERAAADLPGHRRQSHVRRRFPASIDRSDRADRPAVTSSREWRLPARR